MARTIALIGLAVLMGAAIYILCEIRSGFYQNQTGGEISAWKLAVLAVVTFLAFHLIYVYMILPAYAQKKERREALEKLTKLKKLENEYKHLCWKYADNEQKIVQVKQHRLSVLAYAKDVEIYLTRLYRIAISEFCKHYIQEAGYVPPCFSQEPKDLTRFYDQVTILTPISHENA